VCEEVAVLISAGVHQLNKPHASLDQPACQQAIAGELAVAIRVQSRLRFVLDVD
jgi:hypothetical protein